VGAVAAATSAAAIATVVTAVAVRRGFCFFLMPIKTPLRAVFVAREK
jgi:hypothetical protein